MEPERSVCLAAEDAKVEEGSDAAHRTGRKSRRDGETGERDQAEVDEADCE
jgi:hypothetical protein